MTKAKDMNNSLLPEDNSSRGAACGKRIACIGIGSNIGDREHYLQEAVHFLDNAPGVEVVSCSSIYETEPVGYTEQPPFLNMAVAVETSLAPVQLLHILQEAEQSLGRTREIRWGPRTIDLDLLLMDDVVMNTADLTVPHPRMWERGFVLIPLLDAIGGIRPEWAALIQERLETLEGKAGVKRWSNFNWRSASERSAN
jgi:2-amino-4-hydroxy-6-hydroxymethyldihydropteridine diphosphokinase